MRCMLSAKALIAVMVALAFVALAFADVTAHAQTLKGVVPNQYETAAIARGEVLGIGTMRLEGPGRVEVLSHQTWTLVYTAGEAGVKAGGGIRVGFRHLSCWSPPQTSDPAKAGYFCVKTEHGQTVQITVDFRNKFFPEYFAWHQMVQVVFPDKGLAPGETLRLVYGDQTGGSPGMRVQPFDETCFVFKTYIDALGQNDYLPLATSPSIEIVAALPFRLNVVMPTDAIVGQPTWCLVRAEDRYGNPATRYRGTIRIGRNLKVASLPEVYTFGESDQGVHRFESVVPNAAGTLRVTIDDGQRSALGNPVCVRDDRAGELLLWGDLHGHTLLSDGRGTVEEFYDFADRVAGLDFCAVTDHAFEILDEMWEHSKDVTNRVNEPGRFVTFQAFEWSGTTPLGGDHNCYFLDADPPIFRSTSYYEPNNLQMYHGSTPKQKHIKDVFAELAKMLRQKDVLCIPHYGGRQGNPKWHDSKVQRMIEIFSEHRRSEDWVTPFLKQGYRLGIIASTDGHFGNPGYGYLKPTYQWDDQEIGMAAVAVYAPERTRESVFRALYDRRVYATSGDRIVLRFRLDDHPMGSECRTNTPPVVHAEVIGTSTVVLIEIKKNSKVVHQFRPEKTSVQVKWRDPDFDAGTTSYYYVRIVQDNNEEAISSPVWVN